MSSGDQQHQARSVTQVRDLPIGVQASGTRQESDSMGTIAVPADHYWGAQTQRSLIHFSIGDDHLPKAVYHAYGYVKKAAAMVNAETGPLSVIVLGSSGPAAAGRASSGYLVLVDGEARFLVDAGSGIFTRLGEAQVTISRLDTVFLTHLHIDHAAELPSLFKARAMVSQEAIHFSVYGPLGKGVYPSTSQFVHLLFDSRGAFAYQKSFQTTETISVMDFLMHVQAKL